MLTYWLIVLLAILTFLVMKAWDRSSTALDGLPGPRGWPLVGSLFSLGELPHETFRKMARRYGNVFGVRLGSQDVVVLHGMKAVRDALLKQAVAFAGRPKFYSMENMHADATDIIFSSYNKEWVETRKIVESAFKTFVGDRQQVMEDKIIGEGKELIRAITNGGTGHTMDPHDEIHLSVANIIVFILYNENYSHDNREVKEMASAVIKITEYLTGSGNIADFLPVFRYLPSRRQREFEQFKALLEEFVDKRIRERKLRPQSGTSDDILDYMLSIRKNALSGEETECRYIQTDRDIRGVLFDICGAGFDTAGRSLYMFVLYMIVYPHVQERARREIDGVIGRDRSPRLADRPNLPYVDAIIHELLRHSSLLPLSVPHATIQDTQIYNYAIPKDTPVFPCLHSANYDETEWENPDDFNPERFLSEDGHALKKTAAAKLMSFSAGKRRCPGEQLGHMQLFLFITLLLQQCTFEKGPGENPKVKMTHGLTLCPERFRVLTKVRQ